MNNRSEALTVPSPETELLCSQECKIHYSGKPAGKRVLDCSHRDMPEKGMSPAFSLLLWNSNTSHLVLKRVKKVREPWKTRQSQVPYSYATPSTPFEDVFSYTASYTQNSHVDFRGTQIQKIIPVQSAWWFTSWQSVFDTSMVL